MGTYIVLPSGAGSTGPWVDTPSWQKPQASRRPSLHSHISSSSNKIYYHLSYSITIRVHVF